MEDEFGWMLGWWWFFGSGVSPFPPHQHHFFWINSYFCTATPLIKKQALLMLRFRFQISDLDLFQNQKLSTYDTTDKFILDISTIDHINVAKLVHG